MLRAEADGEAARAISSRWASAAAATTFGSDSGTGTTAWGGMDDPSSMSASSTRGVRSEGSNVIAAIGLVFAPSYGSVSGTTEGAASVEPWTGAIAGRRSVRYSPAGPRIAAGVYGLVFTRPPDGVGRGGGGVDTLAPVPGGAGRGRTDVLTRACGGSAVIGVGSIAGGGVAVGSTTTPGCDVACSTLGGATLAGAAVSGFTLTRVVSAAGGAAMLSAPAAGTSSPSK